MRKRSTEIWIMFGFMLVALIVGGASMLAVSELNVLWELVQKSNEPNIKANAFQQWITNMNEAESRLRTYILTQERQDLERFINSTEEADSKFARLKEDFKQDDQLDTLNNLVERKVSVLNELIPVVEALKANNPYAQLQDEIRKEVRLNEKTKGKEAAPPQQSTDIKNLSKEERKALKEKQKKEKESDPKMKIGLRRRLFGMKKYEKDVRQKINKLDSINQIKSLEKRIELLEELIASSKDIRALASEEEEKQIETVRLLSHQEGRINDDIRAVVARIQHKTEVYRITYKAIADERREFVERYQIPFLGGIAFLSILLIVVIFVAFSRNRKLQAGLEEERQRAEGLAHAKQEFLANMSHEFRTPLNAIIGFSEQLYQSRLNPSQQQQVGIIQDSSDHLLAIINDVLDYSKITSGNFTFSTIPFNPRKTIEETVNILQYRTDKKGLSLDVQWKNKAPFVLKGDPLRLKQILINIIGNAIKFTEKGGIHLILNPKVLEKDQLLFNVVIKDTGIGIPEEKLDKIFDAFQQASDSTVQSFGGTGLGLAITKDLIELQNGKIAISSKAGKGTVVSFSIPYLIGEEKELKQHVTHSDNGKSKRKNNLRNARILIADDDMFNRELASVLVKKQQAVPLLAENGKDAWAQLQASGADFVLADLNMPEMGGLELVSKMRSGAFKKLPVYIWTATSSPELVSKARSVGANGVLLKPAKEGEFVHLLESELNRSQNKYHSQKKSASTTNTNMQIKYELEELFKSGNGDRAFVVNMLRIFINSSTQDVRDLEKAVKKGAPAIIKKVAHKMKGPCKHMGIDSLVAELLFLEKFDVESTSKRDIEARFRQAKLLHQKVVKSMERDIKIIEQE